MNTQPEPIASVELPLYTCHKQVRAAKITEVCSHGMTVPTTLVLGDIHATVQVPAEWMHEHTPTVGGYYVVYKDGYASFSPAAAFEEGYARDDQSPREPRTLTERIAAAINASSAENGSDTPDFILADFLLRSLIAFDEATNARKKWYGRTGAGSRNPFEIPPTSPDTDLAVKALQEVVACPLPDLGNVSDGYHTFNELYEHRHALFLAFLATLETNEPAWMSGLHDDGTGMPGWFIAGVTLPSGQAITYHLPNRLWAAARRVCVERERAPAWDGHTSADVVYRLFAFIS